MVSILKTLDTIGNCQRRVFSLGVSQHRHKTKPVTIGAQLVVEVAREYWKKKHPALSHEVVCFQILDFEISAEVSKVIHLC